MVRGSYPAQVLHLVPKVEAVRPRPEMIRTLLTYKKDDRPQGQKGENDKDERIEQIDLNESRVSSGSLRLSSVGARSLDLSILTDHAICHVNVKSF